MAAVSKRIRAGKVVGYRVRYVDPDGNERQKSFPLGQKSLADTFANDIETKKVTGHYIDVNAGKRTFRDYAEEWQGHQGQHRTNTKDSVGNSLKNHIYPTFGSRQLSDIKPSQVRSWLATLTDKGLSSGTVALIFRHFSMVLHSAATDKVISDTQAKDLVAQRKYIPEVRKARVKVLPAAIVAALIAAFDPSLRRAVIVSVGAGLRLGEVLGLTKDKVDFLRKTITVDRQLINGKLAPCKSKRTPVRVIPVEDTVINALAAQLATLPTAKVWDDIDKCEVEGLIFTTPTVEPVPRTTYYTTWRRAAQGIKGLPPRTSHHDLRHFYASSLIRYGLDVKTVAERLGDTVQETLDTYTHLWDDSEDRTREAVAESMAEVFGDDEEEREAK